MSFDLTPLACDTSDPVHQAEMYRRTLDAIAGAGVAAPDALVVSEKSGTPNMSVDVAAGHCFIQADATAVGVFSAANEAVLNVPLSASDPVNDRIDLILATVDNTTTYTAAVTVQEGTPAAVPIEPAVTADHYIVLAEVLVQASSSSITDGDITDRRHVAAAMATPDLIAYTGDDSFDHGDYPGLKGVKVRLVGGGGSGSGAASGPRTGSAGGGGGYAEAIIPVSALAASETVTIGQGGAGTSGAGVSGGTTSFGAHVSATGGGGGQTTGTSPRNPGSGGIGTVGDILIQGQGGAFGNASGGASAAGGSSALGGGGRGMDVGGSGTNGQAGGQYGGGGSGGYNNGVSADGGDGADGVCIVELIY